ncbi:MAG: ribosome biogenesis GTP-binding protein YihA/YsxC [Acidimicrobiia bacterium]
MSPPLDLEFLLSAPDARQLPPSLAEVAIIGRSNVGKSSLLNALARRKHVAHTSKTPGRTQLLNCYSIGAIGTAGATPDATLVDCPGYGYAAVSKATRGSWQKMIERYLVEREQLTMAMLLVDGEIGPTKLDLEVLDWLRANTVPHSVVATKHDKVKSSKRDRRRRDLATLCMLEPSDVLWVSAAKDTGIDRLRDMVRLWLALR